VPVSTRPSVLTATHLPRHQGRCHVIRGGRLSTVDEWRRKSSFCMRPVKVRVRVEVKARVRVRVRVRV
jgi:hypothetical protein